MREVLSLILILVTWVLVLSEREQLVGGDSSSPTKIEDHWATSALEMSDLLESFSHVSCFGISSRQTLECLAGFNEAGALVDPPQALWPRERAGDHSVGRVLQNMGPIVLVELKVRENAAVRSHREFLKKRFELHRRLEKAALTLFHAPLSRGSLKPSTRMNFIYLLHEARKKLAGNVSEAMFVGAALSGRLSMRDPHSYVAPASLFREWVTRSSVEKSGVGVVLHPVERGYRIFEVIPGSAAERAGLKTFDLIRAIDGEFVDFRLSQDDVTSKLSGPIGSQVEITIERGPRRARLLERITVVRSKFTTKNVTLSAFREGTRVFVNLKIRSFLPNDVCEEVQDLLEKNEETAVDGIVLDLRNNLGGSVDRAACVAGLLLGPGKLIVKTHSLVDSKEKKKTGEILTDRDQVTRLPLVVLVNEVSASAAEIVAGALRDHDRALLLGERSFGKGTIQTVYDHRSDPSGTLVALTEQVFVLPSGASNQGHGLEPDFKVPYMKSLSLADRWSAREADLFPTAVVMKGQFVVRNESRHARLRECLMPLSGPSVIADRQLRAAIMTLGCEIDDPKILASNP